MIKLLLVDDEPIICQGLRQTINWKDFDIEVVDEAYDGKEAIEKIEQYQDIDILLLDIRMPVMDGLELAEKIYYSNFNLKIIMISGYEEFNYAKKALQLGVKNYLLKPVDIDELLNTIKDVIDEILQEQPLRPSSDTGNFNKTHTTNWQIKRTIAYIEEFYEQNIKAHEIADYINVSPNYFSTLFKQHTGMTFNDYLNHYRIKQSKILLRDTPYLIHDIAEQIGYSEYKYFAKVFKQITNVTPTEYRDIH